MDEGAHDADVLWARRGVAMVDNIFGCRYPGHVDGSRSPVKYFIMINDRDELIRGRDRIGVGQSFLNAKAWSLHPQSRDAHVIAIDHKRASIGIELRNI